MNTSANLQQNFWGIVYTENEKGARAGAQQQQQSIQTHRVSDCFYDVIISEHSIVTSYSISRMHNCTRIFYTV